MGIALFAVGFLLETVADSQLQAFRNKRDKPKGSILKTGVWRYSRHPNYFGEALLWWGLYLFAVPKGYWTFFSPLTITLLLRFVSGVPLLEKHFKSNSEFQQYMKETNIFFPGLPKKVRAE